MAQYSNTYIDSNNTYTYWVQDEFFKEKINLLLEQKRKSAQKERKLYLVLNSTEKMYKAKPE